MSPTTMARRKARFQRRLDALRIYADNEVIKARDEPALNRWLAEIRELLRMQRMLNGTQARI